MTFFPRKLNRSGGRAEFPTLDCNFLKSNQPSLVLVNYSLIAAHPRYIFFNY